jgi:hypothetical protein
MAKRQRPICTQRFNPEHEIREHEKTCKGRPVGRGVDHCGGDASCHRFY